MRLSYHWLASATLATLAIITNLACEPVPDAAVESRVSQVVAENGILINGTQANGILINGTQANGILINGTQPNGILINGTQANGILINGTQANGILINGTQANGILINGTQANGILINGILINGILINGTAPNGILINGTQPNGILINGTQPNGILINGTQPNGILINGTQPNGILINGTQPNGILINGTQPNGILINGTQPNGILINGTQPNGILINGTESNGILINGTQGSRPNRQSSLPLKIILNGSSLQPIVARHLLPPEALIGSELSAPLKNDKQLVLRIEALRRDNDVSFYTLSARDGRGFWSGVCGTDATGKPVEAIFLSGAWNNAEGVRGGGNKLADPNMITVACRGFALAKCVEMGYRPWAKIGGTALDGHHQACVRMLRADYCGNGTSWTYDGTKINAYDGVGIQADDAEWLLEAEWDEDGARCVAPNMFRKATPPCYQGLIHPKCGKLSHFHKRTLLMNERPTAGAVR